MGDVEAGMEVPVDGIVVGVFMVSSKPPPCVNT